MSSDIYIKVMRAGIEVYPKVYLQKDNMSNQESAYYGGAAPYFRYWGFSLVNLDIRQSDLCIDLSNIDPKTNALTQYRVINDPEQFPDNHMELALDRMVGK
jgi:hypothetical protein